MAQYMYGIRSDTKDETAHYQSLSGQMGEIYDRLKFGDKGVNVEPVESNLNNAENIVGEVQNRLSAIRILIERLPKEDDNTQKIEELDASSRSFMTKINSAADRERDRETNTSKPGRTRVEDARESAALQESNDLWTGATQLDLQSEKFESEVLHDAQQTRITYKIRADWAVR